MNIHKLRNGMDIVIRKPDVADAQAIIDLITQCDTESLFLAREPGEFQVTIEREKEIITNMLNDTDSSWFVAEYEGHIVGQCSIALVRKYLRYRHRANVALGIKKDYWNLGIGGKLMQECINWAKSHHVEQLELDVVSTNERAIAMYEGFGFKKTGTIHNALKYKDGTYTDEYLMEMIL